MSMSASCQILNYTGGTIMFTSVTRVNDDATWSVEPSVGTHIEHGKSCTVSMGNSSVFFAPRGVGFKAEFADQKLNMGMVYLDDPAIGPHEFKFKGPFKISEENPRGNSYVVRINPE